MAEKICPKCGSDNISYQVVEISSVSKTKGSTTVKTERKKGCIYWLTLGWIFGFLKFIYAISIGWVIALFPHGGGKVEIAEHEGKTKTKVKNKTKAVCQDCGHTWNA